MTIFFKLVNIHIRVTQIKIYRDNEQKNSQLKIKIF